MLFSITHTLSQLRSYFVSPLLPSGEEEKIKEPREAEVQIKSGEEAFETEVVEPRVTLHTLDYAPGTVQSPVELKCNNQ